MNPARRNCMAISSAQHSLWSPEVKVFRWELKNCSKVSKSACTKRWISAARCVPRFNLGLHVDGVSPFYRLGFDNRVQWDERAELMRKVLLGAWTRHQSGSMVVPVRALVGFMVSLGFSSTWSPANSPVFAWADLRSHQRFCLILLLWSFASFSVWANRPAATRGFCVITSNSTR